MRKRSETIGKLGRAPARLGTSQPHRQRAPTHGPPPEHTDRGALRKWLHSALLDNLALKALSIILAITVFLLVMVAVALGATDRIRWKWLVTAGALTYPLYLMHYAAGTAVINRLRDTMDARLLVVSVIAGFLLLSWLVHRFVERPVARLLKRGLDTSFARLRNAGT